MLQTLYTYYINGAGAPSGNREPIPFLTQRYAPPYIAKKNTHTHTHSFSGIFLGGNYTLVLKIAGLYGTGL